jgi:hypothetical protein
VSLRPLHCLVLFNQTCSLTCVWILYTLCSRWWGSLEALTGAEFV